MVRNWTLEGRWGQKMAPEMTCKIIVEMKNALIGPNIGSVLVNYLGDSLIFLGLIEWSG